MAIYPSVADLADRLATDFQPTSAVKRNADGTIDYYERIILEPRPAATPATLEAPSKEPAGASAPSSADPQAGVLPPRKANLVLDIPKGKYKADWINTKTGKVEKNQMFEHSGGTRTLNSPGYNDDIALRILRSD